jgi:hypothetical protein
MNSTPLTLSIVMSRLNEAQTLPTCTMTVRELLGAQGISGDRQSDSGSIDGPVAIAQELGPRVVAVPRRGYDNAFRAGSKRAPERRQLRLLVARAVCRVSGESTVASRSCPQRLVRRRLGDA